MTYNNNMPSSGVVDNYRLIGNADNVVDNHRKIGNADNVVDNHGQIGNADNVLMTDNAHCSCRIMQQL